jgi:hypothetical protein
LTADYSACAGFWHRPAWFVNVSLDCVGACIDVIAAYSASAIAALTGW